MDTQLSFFFDVPASAPAIAADAQEAPHTLQLSLPVYDDRSIQPLFDESEIEAPRQSAVRCLSDATNFVLACGDQIIKGGPKTRARTNIEAICLIRKLRTQGRQATLAEQQALVQYAGWGGIPQIFDERQEEWAPLRNELAAVSTEAEMAAMRRSTQDAHYTSLPVVDFMWQAVQRFGFKGGRILEPSVGIGHFFGLMPGALRARSTGIAVDLDPITGEIAQQLYPGVRVHQGMGFQKFNTRPESMDLVIGNPPFGSQSISDPLRCEFSGLSIHNYFFCRAVEALKPGGILALVVSLYLLDAENPRARQYLHDHTRLLGAIRLPNTAFLANANTHVSTDLLFLQKRSVDEAADTLDWTQTVLIPDPDDGDPIRVNTYFQAHPEQILGEFKRCPRKSLYPNQPTVVPSGDLVPQLRDRLKFLPRDVAPAIVSEDDAPEDAPASNPQYDAEIARGTKVFGLFVDPESAAVWRRVADIEGEAQAELVCTRGHGSSPTYQRLTRIITLRELLREQLRLETSDTDDEAIESHRVELRTRYERFQSSFGYLNDSTNVSVARLDPEWPLLLALETGYDRGLSEAAAKKRGVPARPRTAQLGAILQRRVRWPYAAPTFAATAADSMMLSLAERGRLDLPYMEQLTRRPAMQLLGELGEEVFLDPKEGWVTRDAYLSGRVKDKLSEARTLVDGGQRQFARNVSALEGVIPTDIAATDIHVRLGAPWLPCDVMSQFVYFLFAGSVKARFTYARAIGQWAISIDVYDDVANQQKWGTARRPASDLIVALANNQSIRIYDVDRDGKRIFNESETQAAQDAAARIEAAFVDWIWADPDRRERLCRIYNDLFNTHVDRAYDGAHLARPRGNGRCALIGQNPDIELRPNQLNAVWRGIQTGGGLLDHVVGAGKTYAIVATIMEMRRLELIRRPMIVVPNHLLAQWGTAFQELYPGANVLVAGKEDFERDNRQQLFARIATCECDAVIVAHSSFGFIEVPAEELELILTEQLNDMETSITLVREAQGKKSRSVKRMEKLKEGLRGKLEKTLEAKRHDHVVDFEDLGIDFLSVDESHEFKNLAFSTSLQNIAGLGSTTGSQKAMDLFVKVRSLHRRFTHRNVLFATGTPISNTIAEMYTVQRYLQFDRLKELGLAHFDAWQTTFAARTTDWEIDSTGTGYRLKERLARFCNLPELMAMYRQIADVITRSDINTDRAARGLRLLTPPVRGGGPTNIVVDRSDAQALYMDEIVERAESLRSAGDRTTDNMLCVTNDARKAALDIRLAIPTAVDYPDSKINVAVGAIVEIWARTTGIRGTQLVFCDLSTPRNARIAERRAVDDLRARAAKGEEDAMDELAQYSLSDLEALRDSTFDVYNDIRSKLIAHGVPGDQIAFIHDANNDQKRARLFADVNAGRVRVTLMSTRKGGAGTNVQRRLVALHHLDCPWKPSEVEQREGRIERSGNVFYEGSAEEPAIPGFEIEIYRYATRQTYDSRMWQTIEAKARFIEQLRRGTSDRAAEDIAAQAATAAEMKAAASGNPLIIEEVMLRTRIRQMENLRRTHTARQHQLQDALRRRDAYRPARLEAINKLRVDVAHRVPAGEEFAGLTLDERHFTERKTAGFALIERILALHEAPREWVMSVGTFRGFVLHVGLIPKSTVPHLALEGPSGQVHSIDYTADDKLDAVGITRRLDALLDRLEAEIAQLEEYDARQEAECRTAQMELGQPFAREAEYAECLVRHREVIEQLKNTDKPAASKTSEPVVSIAA